MHSTATFYFHGCLNDFLPASNKNSWIQYRFNSSPSIKDAIEAIGIPHVEAHTITVNGIQTDFNYHLKMEDSVEVYPLEENNITTYKDPDKMNLFVLDVHLGTLARALRTLGFDSIYQNNYSDQVIVQIAEEENRIVLTRDVGLLKQKRIQRGYWLRSQHTDEQLREVIRHFGLIQYIRPFTRCIVCNGIIRPVDKEVVSDQLPPDTKRYFTEFYQCCSCKRVYWKGSHFERMQQSIKSITSNSQ